MSSNVARPSSAHETGRAEASPSRRPGTNVDASPSHLSGPIDPQIRRLAETLPALVWLARPDGFIEYYNQRFLYYLGKTFEEMVGWVWPETLHPDDAERSRIAWETACRTGSEYEIEYRIKRHDGLYRWHRGQAAPFRDEDGQILRWIGTCTEIDDHRRAEEELGALAAQYRAVYDQAAVGIAEVDLDGRFLRANARYGEIVGYPPEELIGRSFLEITHPDDIAEGRDRMASVAAGAPSYAYEKRYLRRDGRVVWVHAAVSRICVGTGRPDRIVAVIEDITGRVRLEESLRSSEERFRGLMEQAPFSIQILALDGTTRRVNRAWEQLWGTTLDAIAGDNILHDPRLEALGMLGPLRRAFEGEAVVLPTIPYDLNETIAGGSRHDDPRRYIAASAYPLKDVEGRVREVVLVHEDVTEPRLAEERLQRSESRYRSLVEMTAAIVWTTAASGEADIYQPAWTAFTGQSADEQAGWAWLEAVHPDDRLSTAAAWARSIATRSPFRHEHRLRRHDGEYRYMSIRAVPMVGPTGSVYEWVGLHTDITEARLAEEALKDSDRHKDEFLATLAHELRNPLAPIRNGLEVMRRAGEDPTAIESARAMMERQLAHLVRLVDDLLDLSRISRGKIELRMQRVELSRVVCQAVETSRPAIEAGGHELIVELPDRPILVDADLTRLAQVIANLLNNAAKYTPRGGQIRLLAERSGARVIVKVLDNGVGIPAPMLPRIFEMFTQVDRSLERSQGGLGIGLSLVKGLVERHGGTVEARSEGHGLGSEFEIILPAAGSPDHVAETESKAAPGEPPNERRRILVVDDNRDAATSLAMLLNILGNETQTAHDGIEALEVGLAFRPDVILLDIGMPRMNGYDAARRIREETWGRGVVLVALTGWGQEDDRRRSREAGFDLHLTKPVEPAALEKMLAGLGSSAG